MWIDSAGTKGLGRAGAPAFPRPWFATYLFGGGFWNNQAGQVCDVVSFQIDCFHDTAPLF